MISHSLVCDVIDGDVVPTSLIEVRANLRELLS